MFLSTRTQALVIAALFGASAAVPAWAADPTGDWQVEGGHANMRIAECSGAMWGVVAWEKKPGNVDSKNPDPAQQSRPTLGMVSLFDMKKKPGAEVWEGEVYDSQTTGRRWSASLTPKGGNLLRIEGCALGFMCSGQDWTRVAPPIPSSPTNAMAKGAAKGPMANAPSTAPAAKQPALPKTVAAAPKGTTAPGQTPDIGDICLLPEITQAIAKRGRR